MHQVSGIGGTSPITTADLGPTQSLQLMFAKLQLELSQTAKANAVDRMDKIKDSQAEQKLVASLLNEARAAQAAAKNGDPQDPAEKAALAEALASAQQEVSDLESKVASARGEFNIISFLNTRHSNGEFRTHYEEKKAELSELTAQAEAAANKLESLTEAATTKTNTYMINGTEVKETVKRDENSTFMSQAMVDYMDKHGLAYDKTGNDHAHTEEQWKMTITSLESRLEQVGTDTQQQMVYVQDFMGQYNSYLQGANAQINASNQTLTALARGQ